VDEDTGEIEQVTNKKQNSANVTLSNLWRLYRDGHYTTNKFGFTRFGEGQIRSRDEEGRGPSHSVYRRGKGRWRRAHRR
jgi:hypothetical protein